MIVTSHFVDAFLKIVLIKNGILNLTPELPD